MDGYTYGKNCVYKNGSENWICSKRQSSSFVIFFAYLDANKTRNAVQSYATGKGYITMLKHANQS